MKRILLTCFAVAAAVMVARAGEREYIWPEGAMPDPQPHQIAAMTDESKAEGFSPDSARRPYIEWCEAPEKPNGVCMILISGGSYRNCCDVRLVKKWAKELTALGCQCVNFVYRTPRPEGLPIYQSAWEDGQRAVRMVRSEAVRRGFDPEKIGTISMSAGSHLATLLATSSQTPAYEKRDGLDDLPCHVNWSIVFAPAYILTDGIGTPNSRMGDAPDVAVDACFKFDDKTPPMCFLHGGKDVYSPLGSTRLYRELRKRKIPAELHLYPDVGHGAFGFERAVEFMRQLGFLGALGPEEPLMERYGSDAARSSCERARIWPEGKTPDLQTHQNDPYLEWHIPTNLTTKAIQIVWSGGSYNGSVPDGFEVAPIRRLLNERGMTVVTVKYRHPRPAAPLAKHTTAWQDAQRVVRIVKSEAAARGLDPSRVGVMGSSAGGHLALMIATSSKTGSYLPIDKIDKLDCSVAWAVAVYPAYALTDGIDCHNTHGGNEDSDRLAPEFAFDLATPPILFLHGDADGWAAMNSVKAWEQLRRMGIQGELHTLVKRGHCFHRAASKGTASWNALDRIADFVFRVSSKEPRRK